MSPLLRLADAIDALTLWVGRLASALLLALVVVVGINVVGRYLFGLSLVWAQELEWHLLAPVGMLGVVALMRERGHVRVDMVYDRLPRRAQEALDLVSMLVGVVVSILLIKYSIGYVGGAFAIDEGSPDPGGLSYRWALKAVIPIGAGLLGLQCLAHAIRHGAALSRREA